MMFGGSGGSEFAFQDRMRLKRENAAQTWSIMADVPRKSSEGGTESG
jgi:hypothetical protein